MGASDSLARPERTSFPYISPLPNIGILKGLPCSFAWLPLRVAPATPEACLSVLAVIVRTDIAAFP
jgi:hypothetical protein